MRRLQGAKYHKRKKWLVPIGYSKTLAGNICVYYKKEVYHYLNNEEKENFNPEGLKEFSQAEVEKMMNRKSVANSTDGKISPQAEKID